jgi:LmbE family N-acetylglucosaminyl deacetylase
MVVVAHPDDETVGAAALLMRLGRLTLVHVTDGAPRDPWFWHQAAVTTREAYARLRATELRRALAIGGVTTEPIGLGCPDQQAALALPTLTRAVTALVDEHRPAIVLTHPYEGGHPDHDACAFIVAAAVRACRTAAPLVGEMAFYHDEAGALASSVFLPGGDPGHIHRLSVLERARKRAMLDCFGSQRPVLTRVTSDVERLRRAPTYDFTAPPHPPPLHYDRLGWPIDSARFRALATAALDLTRAEADGARRNG